MKNKRLLTIISVAFIIIVAIPSQGLTFSKEMHETINGNIAHGTPEIVGGDASVTAQYQHSGIYFPGVTVTDT